MPEPRICTIEGCGKPHLALGFCSAHRARFLKHGDPLGGGTAHGAPQKFLHEVVLAWVSDDCLVWPFARGKTGYGTIHLSGPTQHVHRAVCELAHGPAPTPHHEAAHSCGRGNDGCCNPTHLRWATSVENKADQLRHGTSNRGERCGAAKLTETQVLQIRALRGMRHHEISKMFSVSRTTITNILTRRIWSWLE